MTSPKMVDHLLYEVEDNGICWIRFNRPERMNAVLGTAEENSTVVKVGEYMRAADDDKSVRVIVLTGVGRAFCAGADVRGGVPADVIGERLPGNRNAEDTASTG
jgi:enoyl-CoA hydratase/carnithine racemase